MEDENEETEETSTNETTSGTTNTTTETNNTTTDSTEDLLRTNKQDYENTRYFLSKLTSSSAISLYYIYDDNIITEIEDNISLIQDRLDKNQYAEYKYTDYKEEDKKAVEFLKDKLAEIKDIKPKTDERIKIDRKTKAFIDDAYNADFDDKEVLSKAQALLEEVNKRLEEDNYPSDFHSWKSYDMDYKDDLEYLTEVYFS